MPERPYRRINLTGQVFGRLTVLQLVEKRPKGQSRWLCHCVCGVEKAITGNGLRSGDTKSCGCLKSEMTAKRSTTHGHTTKGSFTPTYHTWGNMIARCSNLLNLRWRDYGGRGIKVCERWKNFKNFLADMGEKPSRLTIDRIDNDGNYEPGNCRWATRKEQVRNTRVSRLIEHEGRVQCLADWADQHDLPRNTLWNRLNIGWAIERALQTPSRRQ